MWDLSQETWLSASLRQNHKLPCPFQSLASKAKAVSHLPWDYEVEYSVLSHLVAKIAQRPAESTIVSNWVAQPTFADSASLV